MALSAAAEAVASLQPITWHEPRSSYDVVIVGGGGHGLATAYYLATRHGITNVAVLEADYIASGNTGRNTTIIRANYAVPEAIRFYDHSMQLYKSLEAETGAAIFHREKGHVWLAHSEMGMRTERGRCLMNQAMGVRTEMLTPAEVKELVPQIDLTGGGRYPIFGASHHVEAATARHDRVAWTYASGATARGVHVIQHRPVTGLLRDGAGPGARVVGVRTAAGDIRAGIVLSAVGGRVTEMAAHAGVRLPVRTHPLHAFVTNDFEQGLDKIVASTELACYVSQTERGQMLIGAEFDSQPSFSRVSSFDALRSYAYKITMLLPFLRPMRILRTWAGLCDISADWSPIMGDTGVDGFLITTGWGTWGFKAIPAGGEALAERIATGKTPELIAPFSLERFTRDHALADQASAGTR
jgi:sarcosine oxidase subunit beta